MRTAITTTSLTLALLASDVAAAATTPEPASAEPSGGSSVSDLQVDLTASLRRLHDDEELLGTRRRRELRTALYHVSREGLGFRLHEDDPLAFEETADIVRSAMWKLTRERAKRHLGWGDSLHDDWGDEPRYDDRRLTMSPRFGLSRDPYLGANVRLRGADSDPWTRFALGLRYRLESGEESVFVQYENGDRLVRFEQVFDDPDFGDQVVVTVHWQW